ncbi:hypothetical protein GCM10020254_20460 [Streptomyces goshikiensis]
MLGLVDRGSILLVVYTAFSAGMAAGIWHQVSLPRLGALLLVEAVLLAVMLLASWYGAGRLGFDRADRIAIQFAGSKKSLAAGLPMASVLFGAQASLAVLPLMLFHQMQLMVCAALARHRARDADRDPERDADRDPDPAPAVPQRAPGHVAEVSPTPNTPPPGPGNVRR